MTTIRIVRLNQDGFTVIPNQTARDPRLTRRAKGLLLELLSHETGWNTSVVRLADAGREGQEAVRKMLAEIEEAGYLRRERHRDDAKRWRVVWVIHDLPDAGKPDTETEEYKNTKKKTVSRSDLTPVVPLSPEQAPARKRDEVFEAVCVACRIDWTQLTDTARGPVNRAVRELKAVGATPEAIFDRAWTFEIRYPDITITPMALAKHWPALAVGGNSATVAHRRTLLEIGEELRSERIRGAKDSGPPALDVPNWETDADGDDEDLDDRAVEAE